MTRTPLLIGSALLALISTGCDRLRSLASAADAGAAADAAVATGPTPTLTQPTPVVDTVAIARDGFCEATVEGSLTGTSKVPGGRFTFGSDYFMSEEELSKALPLTGGAAAAKRDPSIYIFILNCKAGPLSINFGAGAGSTYKDIPFKPGKYKMGNERGKVTALLTADKSFFKITTGEFEFTKFDKTGAKGSFRFEASGQLGTPGQIKASGTFDLGCPFPDVAMCKK